MKGRREGKKGRDKKVKGKEERRYRKERRGYEWRGGNEIDRKERKIIHSLATFIDKNCPCHE